jgi:uncharacterized protein YeaO (DUF488 family)
MRISRVYDPPDGTYRVLVDRLWPRGFRKDDPRIDRWLPGVAPSAELRGWYGHRVADYDEFARRYRDELDGPAGAAALAELVELIATRQVTLITATRDVAHSHLAVLASILGGP